MNEQDVRADMTFKTRFQVLGRCLLEPEAGAIPVVKSQEIVKVLLSEEPSSGWSWHESGRRGGPV